MLAVALAAWPASAHGPPPAIVRVAASNDGSPSVVGLTEGLAQRLGARWVFVCPSLFGSKVVPHALSSDGHSTWIASDTGIFLLDAEGRISPVGLPGNGTVTALANAGGFTFALRFAADASDVLRLDPALSEVVFSDQQPWSLLAGDGTHLFIARTEPSKLILRELLTTGAELKTSTLDTKDWESAIVELRASGGSLYAAVNFGTSYAIFRIEGGTLLPLRSSDSPFVGPAVTASGASWIGSSTQLEQLNGSGPDAAFSLLTDAPLSCLETLGKDAFLCEQHRLHALADGGPGAQLMGLDQLVPPAAGDGDLEGSEACREEWVVFRNDLENIGIGGERGDAAGSADSSGSPAASPIERGDSGACGCRYAHANSAHGLLTALTIYLLVISSRLRLWALRRVVS